MGSPHLIEFYSLVSDEYNLIPIGPTKPENTGIFCLRMVNENSKNMYYEFKMYGWCRLDF